MNRFLKYSIRIIAIIMLAIIVTAISYYQKDIPVDTLIKKYGSADSRFMPLMGMNVHYRDEGNQ